MHSKECRRRLEEILQDTEKARRARKRRNEFIKKKEKKPRTKNPMTNPRWRWLPIRTLPLARGGRRHGKLRMALFAQVRDPVLGDH